MRGRSVWLRSNCPLSEYGGHQIDTGKAFCDALVYLRTGTSSQVRKDPAREAESVQSSRHTLWLSLPSAGGFLASYRISVVGQPGRPSLECDGSSWADDNSLQETLAGKGVAYWL